MKRKGKTLLICLALPLAVGLLASLLTLGGMRDYAGMAKPPLAPPGWLFPVAWTLLYLLMGLASWLVVGAAASEERKQGPSAFTPCLWRPISSGLWYSSAWGAISWPSFVSSCCSFWCCSPGGSSAVWTAGRVLC